MKVQAQPKKSVFSFFFYLKKRTKTKMRKDFMFAMTSMDIFFVCLFKLTAQRT